MEATCSACDDTGTIPCYLGGGYTGVALCYECGKHKATYRSKDYGPKPVRIPRVASILRDGNRVMRTQDFKSVVGRDPMSHAEEWELAHLLQRQWQETQGQSKPVAHQAYEGGQLLERLRAKFMPVGAS